ncbi:hypothetical protein Pcinc_008570 [Petrolisthes cinctipes]|uniref:Uncharacterized protein n=1 Tax=Petrolisthes cinctipes TaxID=88211 RepID=A0AAE1G8K3_PETCI|nr:hypothetical protein Pcinc_008570 [Petrolisthes cinctipes]
MEAKKAEMQKLEDEVTEEEIVGILALIEEIGVKMMGGADIKAEAEEHYNSLLNQMSEKERELDILKQYSKMMRELREARACVADLEGVKQTVREESSALLTLKERLFRESVKAAQEGTQRKILKRDGPAKKKNWKRLDRPSWLSWAYWNVFVVNWRKNVKKNSA